MLIPPVTFIVFFSHLSNHTHLVAILFYIPLFKLFSHSKFKHFIQNVLSTQVKTILCNKPGIMHTVNIIIEGFFQVDRQPCATTTVLKMTHFLKVRVSKY